MDEATPAPGDDISRDSALVRLNAQLGNVRFSTILVRPMLWHTTRVAAEYEIGV